MPTPALLEQQAVMPRPTVSCLQSYDGIIVSSTVGYSDELRDALGREAIFLTHTTRIPIENLYSTPHTLGPDRLAAVIGAHALCPNHDAMVVDMGTAITYDYVTSQGQYLGGNIAPGIGMRLRALHEFTARLPLVEAQGDCPEVGYSTETAIRSGVLTGVKHEIEGYITAFASKNNAVSVFLTGGDANYLSDTMKCCTFANKFLVQEGLAEVYLFNRQQ